MQIINGYPLWVLGWQLGIFAARLTPNAPLRSIIYDASNARRVLEQFVSAQSEALKLSRDAAQPLLAAIIRLTNEEGLRRNLDEPISDDERNGVWSLFSHFASVLATELPRTNVYFVNQRGAWDTTTLIESGEKALPVNLSKLPETSRKLIIADIRESTRCLAFSIPTAVGFHVYRAVEAVVLEYFPILGVAQAEVEKNKNLGAYIGLLERGKVDVKVTAMLRHLKDHYRNPIAHPEEFWDDERAGGAFGFAISAIGVMILNIEEEKKKRGLS